jgi:SNF2 family DNA or RNA helicase|nr:MAG TPA: Chromatin remodeling complex ATPase [Caudoviricetes sp.]
MIYHPHDYQKYSIEFVKTHPVAALLLSMGLGKTSTTLTALDDLLFDSFEIHKVLVIAPLRVTKVWLDEVKKWNHLNYLRCSLVVGTEQERKRALWANADIYIINRENVQWLIDESGIPFDFDTLVVDELSSFKNFKTKRFKSLMKVRPMVKRVIGLTGTPTSNGLMDLWSEFKLLDQGKRLGRFITNYRDQYFRPDKRNGQVVFSYKPLPFAEDAIYDKISDITISMKANDYLNMPELISNHVEVEMSEKEMKVYKELKDELVITLGDEDVTASNAASLSNKLTQMANGAIYLDNHESAIIHDRKLDALEDLIEAQCGKPVLVAYWFKHDLERIENRLEELKINFKEIRTDASIEDWNKGNIEVGLIHPVSAGHGLNLQEGGSTLIWFGLTWSLELYEQTNARLYRQGQKDRCVVIEHIVTKGTIDEKIIKALEEKDKSQSRLIYAVKANLRKSK